MEVIERDKQVIMEQKEREALYVIKKDLSKWLSYIMSESVTPDNFMSHLDTGITLCRLAKKVQRIASEKNKRNQSKVPHLPEDKTQSIAVRER